MGGGVRWAGFLGVFGVRGLSSWFFYLEGRGGGRVFVLFGVGSEEEEGENWGGIA